MARRIQLCLALLPFIVSACSARAPLNGLIYTGVTSSEGASAQMNVKTGEACATAFLGLFAFGEAGIDAARRAGGITSVGAVDEKFTSILGVYQQYCTIAHGK